MNFENELNQIYEKIVQQINNIIPIEWEKFSFNAEVKDEEGGVFFFFKPKGGKEYIYSHYIPNLYGIDKKSYNKELHNLFNIAIELQNIFIHNNQEPWFSVTLLVNDKGKLNVHFDYTNWHESEFGPTERIKYFEYKYLNMSRKQVDINLIDKMKNFEKNQ